MPRYEQEAAMDRSQTSRYPDDFGAARNTLAPPTAPTSLTETADRLSSDYERVEQRLCEVCYRLGQTEGPSKLMKGGDEARPMRSISNSFDALADALSSIQARLDYIERRL